MQVLLRVPTPKESSKVKTACRSAKRSVYIINIYANWPETMASKLTFLNWYGNICKCAFKTSPNEIQRNVKKKKKRSNAYYYTFIMGKRRSSLLIGVLNKPDDFW